MEKFKKLGSIRRGPRVVNLTTLPPLVSIIVIARSRIPRRSPGTNKAPNEQEAPLASDTEEGTENNASRATTRSNVDTTGSSEPRKVSRLSHPRELDVCIGDI